MIRKAVSQAMPGLRRPGNVLRFAAGLVRAVAVELVVGRAILAHANQIALPALSDRVPAALERLRWCPGCIDGRPTHMADIIVLLQRGNLLRGIGCVAAAAADLGLPGRQIRHQEEAAERHVTIPGKRGEGVPLDISGEHAVDDRRMALGQHTPGALGQCLVNAGRRLGRVCGWRQPVRVGDTEHLLANDVAAQHDGAGLRSDGRREYACQNRLPGAGQSAHRDEAGSGG